MSPLLPPAVFLLAAAAAPIRRLGPLLGLAAPLAVLPLLAGVEAGAAGRLFATAFCLASALGGLYAFRAAGAAERAASLVLAGAAVGVALSPSWLELFFFWEAMSLASLVLVWSGGPAARGAGLRYLLVHAAGGSALLFGVMLHLQLGGGWEVSSLVEAGRPATLGAWLILAAVCLNAAVPPLNAWLPDAYPRCTPSGSVFQSAFTTKAAVCVLLRCFAGAEILVPAGAIMAVYGVLYAVLQSEPRRLLSYHIVSQVGYMVAGCGLGTPLALAGAAAHAFCHILYKALLFMGAGAAAQGMTGRPVLALYMIGAFAISGAPGLNGFVSKPMIVEAASGWPAVLLHLASVGTFLSVGLKLPSALFAGGRAAPAPAAMLAAMSAAAALCAWTGLFPGWLYARLPGFPGYQPYAWPHVLDSVLLLAGTALGYLALRSWLKLPPGVPLDADWLYRRPLTSAAAWLGAALARAGERASSAARACLLGGASSLERRSLASGPPTGSTLTWLTALFVLAALRSLL